MTIIGGIVALGWIKQPQQSDRLRRLSGVALFSTLSPRELKIIDGMLHDRHYLANEVIFDEGEEGQALYILLSGTIHICRTREQDNAIATDVIAELATGNFFGDVALLDNSPRSAQARAAENCDVAVFFRADFSSLLETNAVIGYKISLELARLISRRLRDSMADSTRIEAL
ncbi:cyclic nucleotide-binding domain-containing protein [Undibacterium hunanense]|uniref:cyclic nucleotide-binding domain-containing protein n=1 Tax=Undibacterium hunanense TaxID=2762292 RepID=UPI001C9A684C|nr:cyclic nucleotide-binding domain-containing protein [Undibacterium hunanense]